MKLKDMLYALWQKTKAPIATRRITVKLPATGNPVVGLSAPSVSGYTFLCWLQAATTGWVGSTYVTNTMDDRAELWLVVNHKGQSSILANGRVDISALYIRNDLA